MGKLLLWIAALGLVAGSAVAEDGQTLHLGKNSPALHMPVGKQDVFATPAFEDYMYMFFDLCDAMELKIEDECKIYPMNASIGKNAIATEQDGNRLILYDRELSPIVGGDGAMMIIAHELGHHYCHHLGKPGDPKRELEADRFAGAAMRKAGMTLEGMLSVVDILDERPSKSHPGRADRVVAIKAGWNNPETGKACRK
ncbi:ImmA/IrrE family metallo-endopeptidase [Agrobacterium tumefaciens]|uniref:ImmA/IrrE family metallo-endopeptidase n=1 Tax=Agrobacterium tumefaciens TaxID=358 RepID=UPI003BA395CA